MKKRTDPRHLRRREAIKTLFRWSFQNGKTKNNLAKSVIESLAEIDKIISSCAPEWPIKKIAKIDLAILRLAIYELVVDKSQPPKVIIDEAVELAKEFGGESAPAFVNGALGTALKRQTK